jgi:hypothetical protein
MIRRLNALRDACDTSVTRMKASEGKEAARDVENLFQEVLGDKLPAINERRKSPLKAGNE